MVIKLFEEYNQQSWELIPMELIPFCFIELEERGMIDISQSTYTYLKSTIKDRYRLGTTGLRKVSYTREDSIIEYLTSKNKITGLQIKGDTFCSWGSNIKFNDHQDKIRMVEIFEFEDEWFFVRVRYLNEPFVSYFKVDQKIGLTDLLEVLGIIRTKEELYG